MKHLEQLAEALRELTDRYGITMTEVPERLREKILQKVGSQAADDLDQIFRPLLENLLRPLRVRAGHRVSKAVVEDVINSVATLEDFEARLAEPIVRLWMTVFGVSEGEVLAEAFEKRVQQTVMPVTVDEPLQNTEKKTSRASKPSHYSTSESENRSARGRGDGGYATSEYNLKPESPADPFASLSFSEKKAKARPAADDLNDTSDSAKKARQQASDKKAKKPADRLENSMVTPLQPDMMSYQAPKPAAATSSAKPGIDEAFKNLRNGDYQTASKVMMELARAGDTRAQFHLGEFYLAGTGVEQSNDKAKYWFRKAAAHGSLPAKNKLEDLEQPDGQSGCLSCAFTLFLIFVVLKFFATVLT
ncbi:MAG: hypothetical protein CVV41_20480 [Candidatus Riflebacteria bacterium HGW-Riflebacteria-1]|jgi:hypothetical protein|nr:MAG: hypothetical protein CVV41_20480 [Candidatus Riflebacteria bacterium HGW-Riflebacteria-1]